MTKLSLLIWKIEDYQLRYETETYQPEIHNLLTEVCGYLSGVAEVIDDFKDLLKGDENE